MKAKLYKDDFYPINKLQPSVHNSQKAHQGVYKFFFNVKGIKHSNYQFVFAFVGNKD